MHVFQIRGFSGLMWLVLALVAAVALAVLLPASFMWVLWNAVVFEGFKGPEIGFGQGILLWGFMLVALKLILNPEIKLQFQRMPASSPNARPEQGPADQKK